MKRLVLLLSVSGVVAFLAGCGFLRAQPGDGEAAVALRGPVLLAKKKEKGRMSPLRVEEVSVEVVVTGNVAETVMTMRFRNETDRVLEGELVFPLGEGRTVSRYALEVNGRMREGVVVEKARARAAYEEVVRQEVDPGLVEWTKGSVFRTRVYPVPAKGSKTLRIGYEEELAKGQGGLVYRLPLAFPEKLDKFSLRVEARQADGEVTPVVDEGSGLRMEMRKAEGWVLEAAEEDYLAQKAVTVRLPLKAEPMVAVGTGADGKRYFQVVDDPGEAPGGGAAEAGKAGKAGSLWLVWDASGSGGERDRERELAALGGYLATLGEAEVRLSFLRHEVEEAGAYSVKGGDWKALRERIEAERYDGGTDPGRLDFRVMTEDEAVLVSDGIGTLGQGAPVTGVCPVHVLHGAAKAEHGALARLAEETGGSYLNLARVERGKEAEAGAALVRKRFSLLGVEGKGAAGLCPAGVAAAEGLVGVAGRLEGEGPVELTLRYGYPGGKALVERKVTVDPARHAVPEGRGTRVARVWAQKKLAALDREAEKNRAEIVSLATAHGVVTRFTSLLVLDRIEDYVRHGIAPPEEDLRKDYERLLAEKRKQEAGEKKEKESHLERMLTLWKERVKWHGKEFPPAEKLIGGHLEGLESQLQWALKDARKTERKGLLNAEEKKILARLKEAEKEMESLQAVRGAMAELKGAEREEALRKLGRGLSAFKSEFGKLLLRAEREEFPEEADDDATVRDELGGGGGAAPAPPPSSRQRSGRVPVPAAEVDPESTDPFGGGEDFGDGRRGAESGGGGFSATPRNDKNENHPASAPKIALAKWDPKTPWLEALRKTEGREAAEKTYFEWKARNRTVSGFYLDAAGFFMEREEKALALRVLTNIAELDLENVALMRVLAHRLFQLGELGRAEALFREVLGLRPDEPQSARDLALVLEKSGKRQEAADLLWSVVARPWHGRFGGVQMIALGELNALAAGGGVDVSGYDPRFLRNLDCDLRIVLTWDSDNTDMDLWVTGPLGEKCFYSHNRTASGGRMSDDLTQGYGPEEFLIRRALPGDYLIQANYYGSSRQDLKSAVTLQATVITNWGREDEKREAITLRLGEKQEVVEIGKAER